MTKDLCPTCVTAKEQCPPKEGLKTVITCVCYCPSAEETIKQLIHYADMYNLEFCYNGSFGFKKGTGFRASLGENIEMPERVAVMAWDKEPAFDSSIFHDGHLHFSLFVEKSNGEQLRELLKVCDLMTHEEFIQAMES